MIEIDPLRIEEAAQEAFDLAAKSKDADRWQRAIARAMHELIENPFLHFTGSSLLILSPSNEIYEANGACQCRAWQGGKYPCWHRAAFGLARRLLQTSH